MPVLTHSNQKGNLTGRLRRTWEESITMDLKEISVSAKNWVHSEQGTYY